jgi:hypothetical protein
MDERHHLNKPRDWGLLLALALAVVAATPFLTRPGLPHHTDAELHIYRAAELGHVLRGGVFYPRWAPDLYYGYGYPIFNYYAPLTYYLANLFDLFPGVDIVGGVKAVFVLGFFIASLGTYLLGRELFGDLASGVLAAASFTFAPYVVLIDPHARGVLAEHLAICLLPLVFYAFRRLMSGVGARWALLGSVLSLAALVFSHNLLGIVVAALLLIYWIWETVLGSGRERAGWGGLALFLSASIIAFFWLPFLAERDAIKLKVIGPGHFDFHGHFLRLSKLFSPSPVLDLGATAPHYQFNLGLAQWLLALLSLVVIVCSQRIGLSGRLRRVLFYFFVTGIVLIFLMTTLSTPVWERVPGLAYLQFPWRLMGPANLMLAVCAGSTTKLLPLLLVERWRNAGLAAAVAVVMLLALPVLYPPTWSPDFGGTSPYDIIEWERRSLALGTTSTGDFLPRKAARVPLKPARSLVDSYAGPGPVDRVNRSGLPEGAQLDTLAHGPLHDRFAISTPKGFVLRLYTFYFPGWRAYLDGEEAEIDVAGPEGFITVWVPKGEHEVLVRFGDTPPRTAGWIVSILGWAALAIGLFLMRSSGVPITHPSPQARHSGFRTAAWLGGVILAFVALKSGVIDPRDDWLRYTSPPGQALAAQHQVAVNFGGQIGLLGYDLPQRRVRSGETFPVVLYWHAVAALDENYQTFVHLARPLHVLWGQEDHLNPGGLPTTRWPTDEYVWDEYEIRVLPGTPPGEYVINVGVPFRAGGYRLLRYDEAGQVAGDSFVIGSVEVVRPLRQPGTVALGLSREVMAAFAGGEVTLLGYVQPQDAQVTLPGVWPITLFWRAERDQPIARVRTLTLLDSEGQTVAQISGIPVDGYYPFEVWQAGEVVRDPVQFASTDQLENVEAGVYHFGVTVSIDESPLNCTPVEGAAGARDGFVPLGTVKFLVEEKAEE